MKKKASKRLPVRGNFVSAWAVLNDEGSPLVIRLSGGEARLAKRRLLKQKVFGGKLRIRSGFWISDAQWRELDK